MLVDGVEGGRHVGADVVEGLLGLFQAVELDDELALDAPGGLEHEGKADALGFFFKILLVLDERPSRRVFGELGVVQGLAGQVLVARVQGGLGGVADPAEALGQRGRERDGVLPKGDHAVDMGGLEQVFYLGQAFGLVQGIGFDEAVGEARDPVGLGGQEDHLGPQLLEPVIDEALLGIARR